MKFFVVLFAVAVSSVFAFEKGAPNSECSSMTPRHHVDPQTGPAPYDITLEKKAIRAGDKIKVTIKGKTKDNTIKGLLVQARVGETPIGQFDVTPSKQAIQTLDCGNGKNNAVTHVKLQNGVNEVSFYWTAPKQLKEKVVFLATIAQNGGVFWVKEKSAILTVN